MKLTNVIRFGFGVAALAICDQSAHGQVPFRLFGVTLFDNQLIEIDSETGEKTLVGSLGDNITPYGIASRNDNLYTFNPNTEMIQLIDPVTGQAGTSINVGISGAQGEGDLAFAADGIGYLSLALDSNFNVVNDLIRFDITTGTSTRVASTQFTIDGMVFFDGTLYAIAQGQPDLYTINPETGAMTSVGPLGVEASSPFAGLAAAPDGTLFAAIDDRIYRVDRTTGTATIIDESPMGNGFATISGLTVVVVPEPSTFAILGLAGAWFIVRRKFATV